MSADVVIGFVHPGEVKTPFLDSLLRSIAYDRHNGGRIAGWNGVQASANISAARNALAEWFLESDAQWLMMIDTDMVWAPDALARLLDHADPQRVPIVGGLCFGREADTGLLFPTMYDLAGTEDAPEFVRYDSWAPDTLFPVMGTGAAFLLVHRTVFEAILAAGFSVAYPWFQERELAGKRVGEDVTFCMRAGQVGLPVYVHTGVHIGHLKEHPVTVDGYLAQRSLLAQREAVAAAEQPLPVHIDIEASLATLAREDHVQAGMLKLPADLDRYRRIIEATQPEVIVETGTRTGASAAWFAQFPSVEQVITIDIEVPDLGLMSADPNGKVLGITRNSADPEVAARVAELVAGRRCMVSLDSDHSGPHVAREIELYGPLVSPGCYLVVEDGIAGYATDELLARHDMAGLDGSPLDAIAKLLAGNPDWSRDVAIERADPVSHHPAGWWIRNG